MVTQFLKRLPAEQIIEALAITYAKTWIRRERDRTRYFAGVCWKKIKGQGTP
jgi:hypothetical protein